MSGTQVRWGRLSLSAPILVRMRIGTMADPSQQHACQGNVDHALADVDTPLVLTHQARPAREPTEDALAHPAMCQHFEALPRSRCSGWRLAPCSGQRPACVRPSSWQHHSPLRSRRRRQTMSKPAFRRISLSATNKFNLVHDSLPRTCARYFGHVGEPTTDVLLQSSFKAAEAAWVP